MAFAGTWAGTDRTHVEDWGAGNDAPLNAAEQVEIHAHHDPEANWASRTAWGFLDGHASVSAFEDVYRDADWNHFDPRVAR